VARRKKASATEPRPSGSGSFELSCLRLAALALLLAASALAQVYRPGPQVLTFFSGVDDSDQPYALYLPRNYDPARKYPLVVSLHGADSNHRLNMRRVFGRGNLPRETDAEAARYFSALRNVDFVVACPLARGTMGYQGIAEKDVYDMLADLQRRFSIDPDRIYLTGLSMGGGGALWLGLTRPDLWAAVAAVCPAVPPGTEDLAPNALNLPVHLFHGEADPIVPVEVSRLWQRRLLDLGGHAEYTEYPNVLHNSWDFAYRNGAIFDWFAGFERRRDPDRVRFVTRAYRYNTAWWVHLDVLTPGTLASIDARFTGPNQLEIATANLVGFTLNLAGHPRFSPARPLSVTVDGAAFRSKPASALSFSRGDGGWKTGRRSPPPGAKRPGAEGPVLEAVSARHLYVYGTADAPAADELQRRHDMALHAADWSTPPSRLLLSLPVKADRDVTAKDLAESNLVLFGTRETNALIRRFADRLPLDLNAGAADYGLVYVFPIGDREVVVSSGLPWWAGAEEVEPPGFRFLPRAVRLLQSLPDYRLFKGSPPRVVAEGSFDSNWKLPPQAAARMRETGAVVIQ